MEGRSPEVLTHHQLFQMRRRSFNTILLGLVFQLVVAVVTIGVCWTFLTKTQAVSVLIGIAVYLIPSFVANMLMLVGLMKSFKYKEYAFFLLESIRLGGALCLMLLVVVFGRNDVDWLFFCIGLIIILKSNFLVLLKS